MSAETPDYGDRSPIPKHFVAQRKDSALWEAEFLEAGGFVVEALEGYGDTKATDAPSDVEVPKLYSHQPGFDPTAEA